MDQELIDGADGHQQKEADEAATMLLSLPWELLDNDGGYLFQGAAVCGYAACQIGTRKTLSLGGRSSVCRW